MKKVIIAIVAAVVIVLGGAALADHYLEGKIEQQLQLSKQQLPAGATLSYGEIDVDLLAWQWSVSNISLKLSQPDISIAVKQVVNHNFNFDELPEQSSASVKGISVDGKFMSLLPPNLKAFVEPMALDVSADVEFDKQPGVFDVDLNYDMKDYGQLQLDIRLSQAEAFMQKLQQMVQQSKQQSQNQLTPEQTKALVDELKTAMQDAVIEQFEVTLSDEKFIPFYSSLISQQQNIEETQFKKLLAANTIQMLGSFSQVDEQESKAIVGFFTGENAVKIALTPEQPVTFGNLKTLQPMPITVTEVTTQ
ncbi:hypothetical protein CWI84_03525 [Idiomarina tyrosinivorans]|uniref:DUF945 domain-containing protein n=1 Tax=Idiomarina tyrosinivorans TaxID=1445662 RepID=A0A432ZS03_9GAMM|nr:hypothetical protein [Idiomarina tyrosinivorans]RUO80669.1 hypothetical protein CWI84_03525 [Idiomarina tyrosinivorans]